LKIKQLKKEGVRKMLGKKIQNTVKAMKVVGLVTGAALIFGLQAVAGQFYEKNGAAIDGYDPVAYFTDKAAVKGVDTISYTYKDSKFLFATEAHKEAFVKNPEQYVPQFNGYCAYGVAQGAKAKIEGQSFKIVNKKLYLNYDKSVQKKWEANQSGFIKDANKKWDEVSKLTKVVE
jgi:YHS domain-containing protein